MEAIGLFLLLWLAVNNGYGTVEMYNVFGNQTWNEASNDSTCSMVGLNLTGEVEDKINNVTSSIVIGTHGTAWIGAYAKRVWINFDGCYYGRFKSTTRWLTMMSSGDPAKVCLKHCNSSSFVLTHDKCVCYKDVTNFGKPGCIAGQCTNTKYKFCGNGTAANSKNITFHCMCHFSMESSLHNLSGKGDCLAVNYKSQQLIAWNCNSTYQPICYSPDNNKANISGSSNNWLQSLSECYARNKQFAGHGKTTYLTGIPNGTYWVGTFAVTYTFWGRPSTDNDSCVAVSKDKTNNQLTTVVLPCDTFLPALCTNSSMPTPVTTQENILSTNTYLSTSVTTQRNGLSTNQDLSTESVTPAVFWSTNTRLDKTSTSEQKTTSNGRTVTSTNSVSSKGNKLSSSTPTVSARGASSNINNSSQLTTIVGSVVGIFIVLIIIVLVILWRRGVFRRKPSARSNNNRDELGMRNQCTKDNMDKNDKMTNNVYDHLGTIKTKQNVRGEDLYDHTGAESETYGHLNSERYDEDSEYDHTFNHTTSDTYGHLNRSYRHDDESEYDHTCTGGDTYGRLHGNNRKSDNGSNYDHTGNMYSHLNSGKHRDGVDDVYDHTGDMYSHLHAGKHRDVVDDVYDHTGGLGSVYGHTDITKPDGNSVYDNTIRYTT